MPTDPGTALRVLLDAALSTTPAPVHTPPPIRGPLHRRFVLDNDPDLASPIIDQLRDDLLVVGLCDRDTAACIAIALEEALLNALYHGNLEISSKLKENGDEPFHALARERRTQEPYASRRVRVLAEITQQKAVFVITDEGPGFDISALPDPTDPENLTRPSGRGLLLMRTFMDSVEYNAIGNRVTMTKLRRDASRDGM